MDKIIKNELEKVDFDVYLVLFIIGGLPVIVLIAFLKHLQKKHDDRLKVNLNT